MFFSISGFLLYWRTPLLVLFMCVVFTAMYTATASRNHRLRGLHRQALPHVPGAVFAAMGWVTCPQKTMTGKERRTPVFTAALFTVVKTWKPPECPLTVNG